MKDKEGISFDYSRNICTDPFGICIDAHYLFFYNFIILEDTDYIV